MKWNSEQSLSSEYCLGNSNFNAIDIVKFISSILVVCIHTRPLDSYNGFFNFILVNIIARIAVPFFFIADGYFFFRKIHVGLEEKNSQFIIKHTKHLFQMYIIWTAIYTPIIIYGYIHNSRSAFLDALIYIRNLIFVGSYTQLWYLIGLMVAVWIVYILIIRRFNPQIILKTGLVFYIIGLFGQSYNGLIIDVPIIYSLYEVYFILFDTTRNGIFFGFLFVGIGMYFSKVKFIMSIQKAISGFLLSFICMIAEIVLLEKIVVVETHNMYLFLAPTLFFLFYILSHIEIKNNKIYKKLREISVLIYYSHMIFLFISRHFLELMGLNHENSLLRFGFVIICSIAFSIVVLLLEEKNMFKWFRALH